jgi:hypothetical protein
MSGRWLTVLLLASAAVFGACTEGSPELGRATTASTTAHADVDAAPWWEHSAVCVLEPSALLARTVAQRWSPPKSADVEDLVAHAPVSPDGWMFTEERGSKLAGASMWNVRSGEHRIIRRFKDPVNYQAGGGFDGEHVLWVETHSLESFDDFSVYLYDLGSGTNRHLGDNETDAAGIPYVSPLDSPVVGQGVGAWVQGSGPDGQRTVKVVDLETGTVRDAFTGYVNGVSFLGGDLLLTMGDWTRRLYDVSTLQEKDAPAGLTRFDGRVFVTFGDDGSVAYSNDDADYPAQDTELWYAPTLTQPAHLVLRLPTDTAFQSPPTLTSTGMVYPTQGKGSFYVDRKTGNAVRITDAQYFFVADDMVVTLDASSDKAAKITSLRIFSLPSSIMGGCPRRDPQPQPTRPSTVRPSTTSSTD